MRYISLLAIAVACSALSALSPAADETFDSNGVKIRYVTEGEGEPIVLIHGWMGDSSMWGRDSYGNTKLSSLSGFQVIAMDCRGHGKSDKPHEADRYGTEMAEDVVRLLDHLKIKKAHLVGYSMGAFIVGNVAAKHPDRVISAIYGGQAPLVAGVKANGGNEVEAFAKAVEEGKGLGPYLVEVSPAPKPTLEQATAMANILYKGKDLKAFAVSGLSLGDLAVKPEDLARCKAPSLFIYGGNESQGTKDHIAAVRELLVGSEEKVIEGGNHVTTLTKPAFGASVVAFIQSHRLSK